MPTKCTPREAYALCSRASSGRKALLKGHCVPRKTTTTALPSLSPARVTVLLSRGSFSSKPRITLGFADSRFFGPSLRTRVGDRPRGRMSNRAARRFDMGNDLFCVTGRRMGAVREYSRSALRDVALRPKPLSHHKIAGARRPGGRSRCGHDEGDGGVEQQTDRENGGHLDDDGAARLDVVLLELLPLGRGEVGAWSLLVVFVVSVSVSGCVRVRHEFDFLISGDAKEARSPPQQTYTLDILPRPQRR